MLSDIIANLLNRGLPRSPRAQQLCAQLEGRSLAIEVGELEWTSSPAKALAAIKSYDIVGIMDRFDDSLMAVCEPVARLSEVAGWT